MVGLNSARNCIMILEVNLSHYANGCTCGTGKNLLNSSLMQIKAEVFVQINRTRFPDCHYSAQITMAPTKGFLRLACAVWQEFYKVPSSLSLVNKRNLHCSNIPKGFFVTGAVCQNALSLKAKR